MADTKRAQHLKEQIIYHQKLYYNDPDNTEISDVEFDKLISELELLEKKSLGISVDSPTQYVGGFTDTNSFNPIRHKSPMLSLKKATTNEEMNKFIQSFASGTTFIVQPKLDGVSLSLDYKNGKLVCATTRGDGTTGEDVTANALRIKGIPHKLPIALSHVNMTVRGEVVITLEDFHSININKKFANPRNAAAGALRSKTPQDAVDRKLSFVVFDVLSPLEQGHVSEILENLKAVNFLSASHVLIDQKDTWDKKFDELSKLRVFSPCETDGLVVKVNAYTDRDASKNTGHHVSWAIAFKTEGETTETILKEITWQVGKTGQIAPVAELEPARLSGTIISRATMHNLSVIHEKDIRVGDKVEIIRAGDTIPAIVRVVNSEDREDDSKPVPPPQYCPSCNTQVVITKKNNSLLITCPDKLYCPAQMQGRIEHWASRNAADIDAIGPTWIETFYEAGLLEQPSDFYKLHLHTTAILAMDRMAQGQYTRFMSSIEKSKELGLRRTLIGLSIPNCGLGTAKRLCQSYKSIEEVMEATAEELCQIEDIGKIVAHSIREFFLDPDMQYEITALRNCGVFLTRLPEDEPTSRWAQLKAGSAPKVQNLKNSLLLKRVAFTGSLSVSREEFKSFLERAGADVTSSVSARTDYLIVGEKPGSKLKKAQDCGVKIISETEARSML